MPKKTAIKHKDSATAGKRTNPSRTAASSHDAIRKPTVVVEGAEVHGVYANRQESENAVRALNRAGFDDVSLSSLNAGNLADLRQEKVGADVKTEIQDLASTAARIGGGILGLGSLAVVAPILIGIPVFGALGLGMAAVANSLDVGSRMRRITKQEDKPVLLSVRTHNRGDAGHAAEVLRGTRGQEVRLIGQYGFEGADLASREYRDEAGTIHHHTQTYMRDHANQSSSAA